MELLDTISNIILFDGTVKFILLTILPAAFVGALPAEFVGSFSWQNLLQMLAAALIILTIALTLFSRGLRRYESGSAIQAQM